MNELGSDIIVVDGGDMFEGTRTQFRNCFFDNADNWQIRDWARNGGYTVTINGTPLTYEKDQKT